MPTTPPVLPKQQPPPLLPTSKSTDLAHLLVPCRLYASIIHTLTSSFEYGCVISAAVNMYDKPGPVTAVKLSKLTSLSFEKCFQALERAVLLGLVKRVYLDKNEPMGGIYCVHEWVCITTNPKGNKFMSSNSNDDLAMYFRTVAKYGLQWTFCHKLLDLPKAKDQIRQSRR